MTPAHVLPHLGRARLPPVRPPAVVLYGHGLPRALHSFPTRRSSDLGETRPGPDRRRRRRRDPLDPQKLNVDDDVGDRKSTRLNSSHSQSSYAGVWLTKKKMTTNGAGPPGSSAARRGPSASARALTPS